ncbi:hypothetical protein QFZ54_000312 [Sphingomonas faeni]|nr:hypothetical protein [Sphingomonas faeni]
MAAWRTLARTSRRPIIALVDAGDLQKIYFAAENDRPFARSLRVEEETIDHYAYIIPRAWSANMLTRLVPQAFMR